MDNATVAMMGVYRNMLLALAAELTIERGGQRRGPVTEGQQVDL
jgi:hypothetical protein